MKYIKVSDDPPNLYFRFESEDGKIEVGIYPVMYGYRIRAGYKGNMYYHLDLCAGDIQSNVEILLSVVLNILEQNIKFEDFPEQGRRPIPTADPETWSKLLNLAKNYIHIGIPPIHKFKSDLLSHY